MLVFTGTILLFLCVSCVIGDALGFFEEKMVSSEEKIQKEI